jgi:hypothetical protein
MLSRIVLTYYKKNLAMNIFISSSYKTPKEGEGNNKNLAVKN